MHVTELQTKHITELLEQAERMGIDGANRLRKQDLVFQIVRELIQSGQEFICSGTLEVLPDGYGFLRTATTFRPFRRILREHDNTRHKAFL